MNHPSRVARRAWAVACGSCSVHVCHVFARCFAAVPLNHAGVGGSVTQGWYGPEWFATWSWITLMPSAWDACTSSVRSAMEPRCSSTP